MDRVLQDRRNLLLALAGGALLLFAATRISSPPAAPSILVSEVSVAQKALLDAGAIAIGLRFADLAYRHISGAMLVPFEELEVALHALLASVRTRNLVVYCKRRLVQGAEATRLLLAAVQTASQGS